MDQLITQMTERAGITAEQARKAMQMVTSYLEDKLPAPILAQVEALFSGTSDSTSSPAASSAGEIWTSGEVVGAGQGEGPHKDTGTYDARQWVGEGQGTGPRQAGGGRPWTSGEVVGEGQGAGPATDTGTYDARQWVGEGQGDQPATGEPTKQAD